MTLEQVEPLDLLINLGCPDEIDGMTFNQYIEGCPNPEDVTECPTVEVDVDEPVTKVCVYW